MWIAFSVIAFLAAVIIIFLNQPSFGRLPRGERLDRIFKSPNFREGQFRNQSPTLQLTSDKSFFSNLIGFLFRKSDRLRPVDKIPVIKTDFHTLPTDEDILVWLGHGSYYIQLSGKKFLIDPVFYSASPVSFFNKAFSGTEVFKPGDFPFMDYLVITHDHWDHLDYRAMKEFRSKSGKVICPLGVGEHFQRWGYGGDRLIEMDWYENEKLPDGFTVHCLPARHFSGRGLKSNRTLWASYFIESPGLRIFLGGDGGYDKHFAEIGERFAPIELAIIENGQYNEDWRYIHLLPGKLVEAIHDLSPDRVLTVHNSKYALAKHPWDEPLRKISEAADQDSSIHLMTPVIGETVYLDHKEQVFGKWWEGID